MGLYFGKIKDNIGILYFELVEKVPYRNFSTTLEEYIT